MCSTFICLAAAPSKYGPLTPIVTYATYAFLAASALFALFRGRSPRWEPADTEVPRLAERTAVLIGCLAAIVILVLTDATALPALTVFVVLAAIIVFASFGWFVRMSENYLHDAPFAAKGSHHKTQRIIGSEDHLTAEAKQKRSTVSLKDLIWGCGQDFDRVFERKWRSRIKVRYQLAYFLLVLSVILALASGGRLLELHTNRGTTRPAAGESDQSK